MRGETIAIDLIDAWLVRQWMSELMKENLSAASVNRKLCAIRAFFNFLIRKGELAHHPLKKVSGVKLPKSLPVFLKDDEMEALLDNKDNKENKSEDFEDIRNLLILEMFYETGIRCSELIGIKKSDVDMSSMMLKVTGKRNKQRLIPFGERLKQMIAQYIYVRARQVPVACDALFVRKDGRQLTSAIVYYLVTRRLADVTTLSKRSPHVLRHTFATSMLNDGAEIEAVRNLMGHNSLTSTSIYTHVTFEDLKRYYNAHPRAQI